MAAAAAAHRTMAGLVGPGGTVVAIDRHASALALARERLAGHAQVEWVCADAAGDLSGLDHMEAGAFDVLAGRRMLMYLCEPAAVLGRLGRWLRSGGLVVFEESDLSVVPARLRSMPAHDRAWDWIRRTLVAEGAHPAMGFALPATLIEAGCRFERVRAEAVIQGQGTQYPLSTLLQLLAPRMAAAGVATREGIEALRAARRTGSGQAGAGLSLRQRDELLRHCAAGLNRRNALGAMLPVRGNLIGEQYRPHDSSVVGLMPAHPTHGPGREPAFATGRTV